jgi:hypothetical protein
VLTSHSSESWCKSFKIANLNNLLSSSIGSAATEREARKELKENTDKELIKERLFILILKFIKRQEKPFAPLYKFNT